MTEAFYCYTIMRPCLRNLNEMLLYSVSKLCRYVKEQCCAPTHNPGLGTDRHCTAVFIRAVLEVRH